MGAGTLANDVDAAGMDAAGMDAAGMDAAGMDETGMDAAGMDETGTTTVGIPSVFCAMIVHAVSNTLFLILQGAMTGLCLGRGGSPEGGNP